MNLKKKPFTISVVFFVLVIYPIWLISLTFLPKDFSVCRITGSEATLKTGDNITFSYLVDGKEFVGFEREVSFHSTPKKGMLYVVEFPEIFGGRFGRIRPELRVIDESIEVPSSGWNEIPQELIR